MDENRLPDGFSWGAPGALGDASNPADVAFAKATLAAWGKSPTTGVKSPLEDYPNPLYGDMSPLWAPRDGIMLHYFSVWWDGGGKKPSLNSANDPTVLGIVSAPLDAAHLDALKTWATSVAPTGLPGGGCPTGQWRNPVTNQCEPVPIVPPGFEFPTVKIPTQPPTAQAIACAQDCEKKYGATSGAPNPTAYVACMAVCAGAGGQQPGGGQQVPKCLPPLVYDPSNNTCQPAPTSKKGELATTKSDSGVLWLIGGAVLLGGIAWAVSASRGMGSVRENPGERVFYIVAGRDRGWYSKPFSTRYAAEAHRDSLSGPWQGEGTILEVPGNTLADARKRSGSVHRGWLDR